jgi:hypothetical protein
MAITTKDIDRVLGSTPTYKYSTSPYGQATITSSISTNSLDYRTSRYVQGGLTEVGPVGLEWWEAYDFPTDPSDLLYVVEQKYQNRLDLIANVFYADWTLWWIIAQYNNILDPYSEITSGTILILPTKTRLQKLFIQKTGGTPSTRVPEIILPSIIL